MTDMLLSTLMALASSINEDHEHMATLLIENREKLDELNTKINELSKFNKKCVNDVKTAAATTTTAATANVKQHETSEQILQYIKFSARHSGSGSSGSNNTPPATKPSIDNIDEYIRTMMSSIDDLTLNMLEQNRDAPTRIMCKNMYRTIEQTLNAIVAVLRTQQEQITQFKSTFKDAEEKMKCYK